MQLFALTTEKEMIAASQALKKKEHFCMECGKTVRLRGGAHRQNHFYHIKPDPACRQSQKSMVHLQVQWYLYRMLSADNVQLERRFPEISRIADVAWEDQKLIFEVQCSSIGQAEVESRNRDYASLGYKIVWVLHEKRFARRHVSAAEEWLSGRAHYYTNFDSKGFGEIYDQMHLFSKGLRYFSSDKTAVNLASPLMINGALCFKGDWKERKFSHDKSAISAWKVFETERKKLKKVNKFRLGFEIKRWYLNIFNLVLEGCSISQ